MKIQENPFYILGATLRDSRQKIMSLAEEKSLELDDSVCAEARMVLTNPRRRLAAELSWFPGTSVKQTQIILDGILNGAIPATELNEVFKKLNSISAFNLLVAYICSTKRISEKNLEAHLFALAVTYENIKAENVLKIINEERSVSGFSLVDEVSTITEELEALRIQCLQVLQPILADRSLTSLNHIMLGILDRETKHGKSVELVQDYIDKLYAMVVQKDLDNLCAGIETSIENIKQSANRKNVSKTYLSELVDRYLEELESFDNIMQPIQVSMQRRGLEHEVSRTIAKKSRELAIYLSNHMDDLKLCERIVQKTKELFAELGSVEQSLDDDLQQIHKIKEREKERQKAITCHIEKRGIFSTKEIKINSHGIQYRGLNYRLEDIVAMRFGILRRYVNGFEQRPETLIAFKDIGGVSETITWMSEDDFNKFTDALWAAVGFQILTYMVAQLAQGRNVYGFIFNDGVRLTKTKFFSSETKFFKWKDVVWFAHQGSFYIASREDRKFMATMSFMEFENAHPLYRMLEVFKVRPANTISESFGITLEEAKKIKQVDYSYGDANRNDFDSDEDEENDTTSTPAQQQSTGTGEEFSWPLFWAIIVGFLLLIALFAE